MRRRVVAAFTRAALALVPAFSVLAAQSLPQAERGAPADTSKVFHLGTIEVEVAPLATANPLVERVAATDLRLQERDDLAEGLNLFSGVTVSAVGPRNEAGVYVRGFDLRQVPVFIDGIPQYVPYDGYVDLRRFTTFDVGELQVSKGFSSVLLGPNALGGAINVVTRKPTEPLELSGGSGAFTGDGYESYLNAGARHDRLYIQASGSYLKQERFRLADDFAAAPAEDGGDRENAQREDWRASAKVGFTPNAADEYAIGYLIQRGVKGNPPYAGTNPNEAVRYWRWPSWDKQSVYLLTNTGLGGGAFLRGRAYYDEFENALFSYDDATYTTQTRRSSFRSFYDDDTFGGSVEAGRPLGARHLLRVAAHGKIDTHRENNEGEPQRGFRDRTWSVALEDAWQATRRLTVVAGLSYDRRGGDEAEDFQNGVVSDFPLSRSGAWNPQVAVLYEPASGSTLRASVASRTRFPTIKDRYSYRFGTAIPNADLTSERATHYEVGWAGRIREVGVLRASLFYSRIDDLIQRVDDVARDPGNLPLFQLQNVGDAEHFGFEIGGDVRATRWLRVGGNYSWLERNNLTNQDVRLIDTPRAKLLGYAAVHPNRRLGGVVSAEWNSSRFSSSNGLTVDPFAVVSAKLIVTTFDWLQVEVGVLNLFDENYQLVSGFPEPGRTLLANLRYEWVRGTQ